jgi:hypothetical protein
MFQNYIASSFHEGELKFGLINSIGDWIVTPKYQEILKLEINGYYTFYENNLYGIINYKGEIVINSNYKYLEICNKNIIVRINDKYGIINDKEAYNKENVFRLEIDNKFGLINLNSKVLIQPIYERISNDDINGVISAKFNGKTGCINLNGEILIDFRYDSISEFDDKGYAIAGENNRKGFINVNGDWKIHPIFDSVNVFHGEYSVVRISLKYGVINRSGKWVLQPKYSECIIQENNTFFVTLEKKHGVVDVNENWLKESMFDYPLFFDNNDFAITSDGNKYGIINKEMKWTVEPQFDYITKYDNSKIYIYRLSNKYGIINTSDKIITEAVFDEILGFYDKSNSAIVINEKRYGLINHLGETLLKPLLIKINNFNQNCIAIAENIFNKWGIINETGKWVLQPIYDELEDIDEFGLLKASINNKYGWIDITGNFVIQPVFDLIPNSNYEITETDEFNYLVEDVFRDKVLDVYFFDEIPIIKKLKFNKILEIDFVENIEYIMLYNDSIDNISNDGIAIVKKGEDYFLILIEHKWNPVIFSLNSNIGNNMINSLCFDEENHCITVIADSNAKINNKLTYYTPEPFKRKVCLFRFYNTDFLKLFDEFYIRLESEIGWQIS